GTSSAFFKSVVLPRVSSSLNAEVTVRDASISPFKEVVLKDLKVTPQGAEPLLTAPEVRARYHLLDIIRGNIHVDEVAVVTPTITLTENPDGSRNIDPLLKKKPEKGPPGEKKAPTPGKPPQL